MEDISKMINAKIKSDVSEVDKGLLEKVPEIKDILAGLNHKQLKDFKLLIDEELRKPDQNTKTFKEGDKVTLNEGSSMCSLRNGQVATVVGHDGDLISIVFEGDSSKFKTYSKNLDKA